MLRFLCCIIFSYYLVYQICHSNDIERFVLSENIKQGFRITSNILKRVGTLQRCYHFTTGLTSFLKGDHRRLYISIYENYWNKHILKDTSAKSLMQLRTASALRTAFLMRVQGWYKQKLTWLLYLILYIVIN